MDNLEKAKQASLLAADIDRLKKNLENIKLAVKFYEDKKIITVDLMYVNKVFTSLPVDSDVLDLLLLQEEGRLRAKEIELDKLLNGEINKIKSIIEERESE